jgi:hypothetical protein
MTFGMARKFLSRGISNAGIPYRVTLEYRNTVDLHIKCPLLALRFSSKL